MIEDVRWIQRYSNYQKALSGLQEAVDIAGNRPLSKLEQQGVVKAFEYTHELAWKTMKDFLSDQGEQILYGSKDTSRLAFKLGLIDNGDVWMDMIKSINLSVHTYNENTALEIVKKICDNYIEEFLLLREKLQQEQDKAESAG